MKLLAIDPDHARRDVQVGAGVHGLTVSIALLEMHGYNAVEVAQIITTDPTCRAILERLKERLQAKTK